MNESFARKAIRTTACYGLTDGPDRKILEFLEALAMRDRDAIVSQGKALLHESTPLNGGLRGDVILAVSAALLGSDRPQEGVDFLRKEIEFVDRERHGNLTVRLLEAFAIELAKSARPAP